MVKIIRTYSDLLLGMTRHKKAMSKKSLRGYPKGSFCIAIGISTYAVCTHITFTPNSIVLKCYHPPQQGKLL